MTTAVPHGRSGSVRRPHHRSGHGQDHQSGGQSHRRRETNVSKANRLPEPLKSKVNAFPRQALHARLLAFRHPVSGELMRFEAPLPADMEELVAGFRNL